MRGGVTEEELAAKSTDERVTLADVESSIACEHYFTAQQAVSGHAVNRVGFKKTEMGYAPVFESPEHQALSLLTICVLVLNNGFTILGKSACVDPSNFNAEIGRKISRQDAVNQIWPLMGFALKNKLMGLEHQAQGQASAQPKAVVPSGAGVHQEESYLDRMKVEFEQLRDRCKKLDLYLDSGKVNQLPFIDRQDLWAQYSHMMSYRDVLARRLERAGTAG